MAVNEFTESDYLEIARSRITEQFKNQPIIDKYVQLMLASKTSIQTTLKQLMQERSLETAVGAQLDVIGEIVGQPRELISTNFFEYFGFQGADSAKGFGDLNDASVGAPFWELGRPLGGNQLLDDDTYRLFIKAKIIKNSTTSTPEEFIYLINFLFGTSTVYISEGVASFTVYFGRELSPLEKFLLTYTSDTTGYPTRLLPKTVGVLVNFGQFREGQYFGFQGAPGAKGFGGLNAQASGYGLRWGENYGLSDYSQDVDCRYSHVADGSILADGSALADSEYTCYPADGGYFAELINL